MRPSSSSQQEPGQSTCKDILVQAALLPHQPPPIQGPRVAYFMCVWGGGGSVTRELRGELLTWVVAPTHLLAQQRQ